MIRKQIYITEKQEEFLKTFPTMTQSEMIRRALDEYIERRAKIGVQRVFRKQKDTNK